MEKIVSTMGEAVIEKVERKAEGMNGWERRNVYLGFEGNLVIKADDEGLTRASIENGSRCILTSPGKVTLRGCEAVFETENSIYTFRLVSFGSTGVYEKEVLRTA